MENIPEKWHRINGIEMKSGGQATAVPVRHQDGREGVYRRIKTTWTEESRKRFRRELEILSTGVRHKGIVNLFEWSADATNPWYISELGDPFKEWWLNRRKELGPEPAALVKQAVSTLLELSSALAVCHDNGIIHRDIKPGNLIMKKGVSEPWPILIDFGIAHEESGERLTPAHQAVGNARFSPDIMRYRLEEVPPWLDVFDLGQLLIWMLDEIAPKQHWQRPVHWKYAVYGEGLPEMLQLSLRAFTAVCSYQVTSPANGAQVVSLLDKLFPKQFPKKVGQIDPNAIANAKKHGEVVKQLNSAELQEEVQSSAPLAEKIYLDLRETVLSVLNELSNQEPSTQVLSDPQFVYQTRGATDLLWVSVGPPKYNIQLRIKAKIVPWCEPLRQDSWNRQFWQEHMPEDAICFTFALEGGVAQAHDSRYVEGKWVTIGRDGSLYLHPLSASFGKYSDNDLGGAAEGPGTNATLEDVRTFAVSILTNEELWEYVVANQA